MLKFKYDKLEDIPEELRKYYAEQDGAYYLQAEGVVPKARLDEFRDNNIKLTKERDDLKTQLEGLNITVDELDELRKKAEQKVGKKGELSEEERAELVEAEVAKRIKKMKEDYDKQLGDLTADRDNKASLVSKLLIDNETHNVAAKAGVREEAIPDLLNRVKGVFSVDADGKVLGKDGEEIIYGKDGTTPLSIGEWVNDRKADAPHLFKESGGAGSKPQQKTTTPGGGKTDGLHGRAKMRAARQASS